MGPHLSLSEGDTTVVVRNFFTLGTAPDLTTESGHSVIDGSLAVKLAGSFAPGQFAQVVQLAQSTGASSIGTVEKLSGTVTLTRTDGTSVQASKGTSIFSGDVIKTEADANIGIKFVDETSFSLGESGRMVIDEMIYDPSNNSNSSSSFSVVKGVFSFVSGQVAKSGDDAMVVKTPVASIGIRGTTVAGKAAAEGSSNSITLLPDADGGVGQIAVSNSAGTQIMSVPFQTTSLTSAFTAPPPPVVVPANQLETLYGSNIKTVLPPAPAQQQQQQQDGPASDTDAPSGEGEQEQEEGEGEIQEGEAESETPEGEGEEGEREQEEGEGEEQEGEERPGEEAQTREGDGPGDPQEGPREEEAGLLGREPENELEEGQQKARAEELSEEERDREALDDEVRERDAVIARNREEDREIADEAFQEAIKEGVDPREAAYRADQAVRDNKVGRRFESLEEAVGEGKTLEQALGDEINRSEGSIDDLFITREGAFRSLDTAFRDPNSEGFGRIVNETFNEEKGGESAFRNALLDGGSIDDAFNAAFKTNIAAGSDFIEANIFTQGFDPGLVAQSRIIEQVNEAFITKVVSSGLITNFTENITLTAGDDNVSGAPGAGANTTFIATQGTTLGGNDTIDGGAGTDQLNLLNLSNLLIIGSSYTNPGGDISGRISLTNVEQINFVSAGGDTETFGLAGPSSSSGTGFVVVGTSGNDTLSIVPDGTSKADLSKGTLSLDIDGNGTGINTGAGVLFADGGDDTITFEGNRRFIFGGDGDDTITLGVGEINVVQGGAGNDTFVLEEENSLFGSGGRFSSVAPTLISGGDGVDTLQIGNSSTAANQTFTVEGFDSGAFSTISGMEKLHFFQSGTVFKTGAQMFTQFSTITAESGVTDVTLTSANGVLNLSDNALPSAVTVLTAIAPATDPTFQDGGVRIFDGNDAGGRTLIGTANADTLSGFGGNDIFQMGGGRDTLSGGDGDDTFVIAAASDISAGIELSGGNGTDRLVLTSTDITFLSFPVGVSLQTLEIFDVSGGSAAGVGIGIVADDLESVTQITGDGTTDGIFAFFGDYNLQDTTVISGIERIVLPDQAGFPTSNGIQILSIKGGTTLSGLNEIAGTVNDLGETDDTILLSGDRDFSGITFTNINELDLSDGGGVRQTIGANASTSLGLTEIDDFTGGSGSTTDRFDYKSNLVSGNGTSVSASNDFTLTEINSGARATNVISANATGVIDFETTVGTNNLGIDITSSTLSQITTAVEALLESTNSSTNLTGSSAQVTQGAANTDSLLVFYDNSEQAAIIRYQEGSTSEADFSGELSVVAIFDDILGSGVTTFDNANII